MKKIFLALLAVVTLTCVPMQVNATEEIIVPEVIQVQEIDSNVAVTFNIISSEKTGARIYAKHIQTDQTYAISIFEPDISITYKMPVGDYMIVDSKFQNEDLILSQYQFTVSADKPDVDLKIIAKANECNCNNSKTIDESIKNPSISIELYGFTIFILFVFVCIGIAIAMIGHAEYDDILAILGVVIALMSSILMCFYVFI